MANDKATDVIVPFVDLHAQYQTIKSEIDSAIASVIERSSFVRGEDVESFEESFANMVGAKYCISCANGTEALYITMVALGIKPGDEVIVPAMTWISTSETVTQAGGKVVFCDIDPVTNTLDPVKLEECITSKTVGVIPVHLYGHPAEMDKIMDIASSRKLWVIEDSAQAHLSKVRNRMVGSFGVAATYSFYPGKNLGAMGDAGAITTDDPSLADFAAKFARHGGLRKGDHEIEGINSRLDGLQAAILNVKLRHIEEWTQRRRDVASEYQRQLTNKEVQLPSEMTDWAHHVWHLFVIQSENRNEIRDSLNAAGVQTSINYPRALPSLPCYSAMGHKPGDFPVAEGLAETCLCLPIYPEMTEEQLKYVAEHV